MTIDRESIWEVWDPGLAMMSGLPAPAAQVEVLGDMSAPADTGELLRQAGIGVVRARGFVAKDGLMGDDEGWEVLSLDRLSATLAQMEADPEIGTVVVDVASPGGMVVGVREVMAQMRRMETEVLVYSDTLLASAAYHLALGADEIWAAPSAMVGSIGVRMHVYDLSKSFSRAGIEVVVASSGDLKALGLPGKPVTKAEKGWMVEQVNAAWQVFRGDVLARRGEAVPESAMRGQVMTGEEAVDSGLVDRTVDSLGQALGMLLAGTGRA